MENYMRSRFFPILPLMASLLSIPSISAQDVTSPADPDYCFSVSPCPNVVAPKRVRAIVDPNAAAVNGSADIYNPNGRTFTALKASMNVPRESHVAILLRDGRVLIAGGRRSSYLDSAEIFNPAARVFSVATKVVTNAAGDDEVKTSKMNSGRGNPGAVVLLGGKVLIAGGFNGVYLSSAELYDPGSGVFGTTGAMANAREGFTTTLMPSTGKVLVAGGYNDSWLNSAELYDPSAGSFATTAGAMNESRRYHTASLLSNDKILLTGGQSLDSSTNEATVTNTAEIYSPNDNDFYSTGNMITARMNHTATLLPDGKVLIAGGADVNGNPLSSAEIYDPNTGKFTATGSMTAARTRHSTVMVNDGSIVIAGGLSAQALATAEVYDPARGVFTPTTPMSGPRFNAPAVILNDGTVLYAGGIKSARLRFDINDSDADNISTNIVFSPDSKAGFVSYSGSGGVLAFSVQTGQVLKEIYTGGFPTSMTLLKDGKNLAVTSALDNRIFLVGMDTLSVKATYSFSNAQFGWGSIISLSPDGNWGYISSTGTGEVIKFNVGSGAESKRLTGLETPTQITVTPDGNTLIVVDTSATEVEFVDSSSMAVNYKFAPTTDDNYSSTYGYSGFTIYNRFVLTPDGTAGIIASRDTNSTTNSTLFCLETSTAKLLYAKKIGYLAGYTTLTPDRRYWVVFNEAGIDRIPSTDPAGTVSLSTVAGNDIGSANIVFSPDSKYAYYVSSTEDHLFQHSVELDSVFGKIQTGHASSVSLDQSSTVAITPDGQTIAVLNFVSDNIVLLTDQPYLLETKFVSSGNQFTGLSIVNLSGNTANVTVTALDDFGTQLQATSGGNEHLVNPVYLQLGPNAQTSVELSELFTFNRNYQNTGQLVVTSDQSVAAFAVLGEVYASFFGSYLGRMDGWPLVKEPLHTMILPDLTNDTGTSVEANIVNPNYNAAKYDLTTYGRDGGAINTKTDSSANASSRSNQGVSDLVSTSNAKKVILIGGSGCPASAMTSENGELTRIVVSTAGSGYTKAPTVTISAPPSGGTNATALATLNASGGVVSIALTNPGSKYTSIPTVTISAPDTTGTQAVASAQMAKICSDDQSLNSADSYDGSSNSVGSISGSLATAREGHAAVQMQSGAILVTGGKSGKAIVSTAEIVTPSSGSVTPTTGSMTVERYRHSATVLDNGTVLIAGGQNSTSVEDTAELYFPGDSSFYPAAGKMTTPRESHSATRLSDGTVLLVGGLDGNSVLSSAEIYDPATSVFRPTGSMSTSRAFHTATMLSDGRILIVGGYNGDYLRSAEIYDPLTGQFTSTGTMSAARATHTCTVLNDGTVLVAGGTNGDDTLDTAEIYDPLSGVFVRTASTMTEHRSFHSASLLSSHSVLIAGGTNGRNTSDTLEVFDPGTQSFTAAAGTMSAARQGHTSTFVDSSVNGYVRIHSYPGLNVNEVYNGPNSGTALAGINVANYEGVTVLYSPQFVIMPGYKTSLNLINANQDEDAQVTITLHNSDGKVIGNPLTRKLHSNAQIKDDLANLFLNDAAIQNKVGWLEIGSSVDQIVGTLTFSNEDGTFFAPYELSGRAWSQWVFPLAIQNDLYVSAFAVLNSNSSPADMQVEVWDKDGRVQATTTVTLAPRSRIAKYLNDLFPTLPRLDAANVRIRSTQPLHGFELLHDKSLNFIITVPPVPFP
jgi:6-phosphogluconolactonase (cycloisomerase 2 family)